MIHVKNRTKGSSLQIEFSFIDERFSDKRADTGGGASVVHAGTLEGVEGIGGLSAADNIDVGYSGDFGGESEKGDGAVQRTVVGGDEDVDLQGSSSGDGSQPGDGDGSGNLEPSGFDNGNSVEEQHPQGEPSDGTEWNGSVRPDAERSDPVTDSEIDENDWGDVSVTATVLIAPKKEKKQKSPEFRNVTLAPKGTSVSLFHLHRCLEKSESGEALTQEELTLVASYNANSSYYVDLDLSEYFGAVLSRHAGPKSRVLISGITSPRQIYALGTDKLAKVFPTFLTSDELCFRCMSALFKNVTIRKCRPVPTELASSPCFYNIAIHMLDGVVRPHLNVDIIADSLKGISGALSPGGLAVVQTYPTSLFGNISSSSARLVDIQGGVGGMDFKGGSFFRAGDTYSAAKSHLSVWMKPSDGVPSTNFGWLDGDQIAPKNGPAPYFKSLLPTADGHVAVQQALSCVPDTLYSGFSFSTQRQLAENISPEMEKIRIGDFGVADDGRILQNLDGVIVEVQGIDSLLKHKLSLAIRCISLASECYYLRTHGKEQGFYTSRASLVESVGKFYDLYGRDGNYKAFSSLEEYYSVSSSFHLLGIMDNDWRAFSKKAPGGENTIFAAQFVGSGSYSSVSSVKEAYIRSYREKGSVCVSSIAKMCNISEEDVISELEGQIFFDPSAVGGAQWVSREVYCSGDVVAKLNEARLLAASDSSFLSNVEALEKSIPAKTELDRIDLAHVSTFVTPALIKDFIAYYTAGRASQRDINDLIVVNEGGQWSIGKRYDKKTGGIVGVRGFKISQDPMGTNEYTSLQILGFGLNGGVPQFSKSVSEKEKATLTADEIEAILNERELRYNKAVEALDALNNTFVKWVEGDPDIKNQLTDLYNATLNRFVPFYPDLNAFALHGAAPDFQPDLHQLEAIARGITQNSLLVNHCTGAGKTFVMAGIANERYCRDASKIAVIVPKSIYMQVADDFSRYFPGLPVFRAAPKSINKTDLGHTLKRAMLAGTGVVLFTEESFQAIPLHIQSDLEARSAERQELYKKFVSETSSSVTESIAKKIQRIDKEISALREDQARFPDSILDFGFSGLIYDEAHRARNISLKGPLSEGNPSGKGQADDLLEKVELLRKDNPLFFTVLSTATVMGRKAADIYAMIKIAAPGLLRGAGLSESDIGPFLKAYGRKTTFESVLPNNTIKFIDGWELVPNRTLAQLLGTFTHTVVEEDIPRLMLGRPKYVGGGMQTTVLSQTPDQKRIYDEIRKSYDSKSKKNILNLYTMALAAAVDARLVDKNAQFDPGSKCQALVNNAVSLYNKPEVADHRGTQLIFCERYQRAKDPDDPNDNGFDFFDDIKTRLVERGVPESEIAIIDKATSEGERVKIFNKFRMGDVRFLIGTRAIVGTGVNIQDRIICTHNMDVCYNPTVAWQGDGRARRFGNVFGSIYLIQYLTESSGEASVAAIAERKIRSTIAIFQASSTSDASHRGDDLLSVAGAILGEIKGDYRSTAASHVATCLTRVQNKIDALSASADRNQYMSVSAERENERLEKEVELLRPIRDRFLAAKENQPAVEIDGNVVAEQTIHDQAATTLFNSVLSMIAGNKSKIKYYGFDIVLAKNPYGNDVLAFDTGSSVGNVTFAFVHEIRNGSYKTPRGFANALQAGFRHKIVDGFADAERGARSAKDLFLALRASSGGNLEKIMVLRDELVIARDTLVAMQNDPLKPQWKTNGDMAVWDPKNGNMPLSKIAELLEPECGRLLNLDMSVLHMVQTAVVHTQKTGNEAVFDFLVNIVELLNNGANANSPSIIETGRFLKIASATHSSSLNQIEGYSSDFDGWTRDDFRACKSKFEEIVKSESGSLSALTSESIQIFVRNGISYDMTSLKTRPALLSPKVFSVLEDLCFSSICQFPGDSKGRAFKFAEDFHQLAEGNEIKNNAILSRIAGLEQEDFKFMSAKLRELGNSYSNSSIKALYGVFLKSFIHKDVSWRPRISMPKDKIDESGRLPVGGVDGKV